MLVLLIWGKIWGIPVLREVKSRVQREPGSSSQALYKQPHASSSIPLGLRQQGGPVMPGPQLNRECQPLMTAVGSTVDYSDHRRGLLLSPAPSFRPDLYVMAWGSKHYGMLLLPWDLGILSSFPLVLPVRK